MANTQQVQVQSASGVKAFDPKGKTFTEKLTAFLVDAKKTHGVTVRKTSGTRTLQWQQKHHVAHMFVHNKYGSHKPANVDAGEKTISWSHFSSAKTKWHTVKFSDFLRTKDGKIPVKKSTGAEWQENAKPDKVKTIAHVKKLQTNAGIGNRGAAMVASGLKPCKSPCACTVKRSKHVSGVAQDYNGLDLTSLTKKLAAAKAGTLDDYLKKFGLHRPIKDHPSSPEKWHIEAL